MIYKTYSDIQLVDALKQTVNIERESTVRVLWLLREVEHRMLYASRGYSSLFQYCISELRYSESAAQRRITSMRLLRDLSQGSQKEVEAKLSNGDLNLSHLSQIQSHLKSIGNIGNLKNLENQEFKLDLIDKVAGTSSRKCEQILASLLPEQPLEKEKSRPISAQHSRVTLIVSNDLMQKIERIQNARAHQLKEKSILEVLNLLVDEEIKRDEKKKGLLKKSSLNTSPPASEAKTQSRYISRKVYRELYQEADHRCQFTDTQTGKSCDSRHKLQVEHCLPFALGGSNEIDNLQLLCAIHNALKAKKVFGCEAHVFQNLHSL